MVRISLTHIGDLYIVSAIGHANYNEHGKDIVCASVSILTQSFAMYCEDRHEQFKCSVDELVDIDGKFYMEVRGDVREAYKMLCTGIKAISDTYPDYVLCEGGN